MRFDMAGGLSGLPQILYAGCDSVNSPSYRWDGATRGSSHRCAFQYTLEGGGRLRYHGRDFEVGEGKAFAFDIGDPDVCYYYPSEGKRPWRFVYCVFSGFEDAILSLNAMHGPVYDFGGDDAIARKIFALMDLPSGGMQKSYALCAEIIGELCGMSESRRQNGLAEKAMRLIRERRLESFSLKELSSDLGVRPEHLCREFKRHFGVTPKCQHEKLLAEAVCERLLAGSSIKAVAMDFGFNDISNFNKFFKRRCAVTPGQFKRYGSRPLHDMLDDYGEGRARTH